MDGVNRFDKKLRFAVMGDPVEHSLSPSIYGALFSHFGIDGEFIKLRVTRDDVCRIRQIAAENGLSGFACTMPLKELVIPLLDGISEEAERISSVNIVDIRNGRLFGSSTDGYGIKRAVDGRHSRKRTVIIGSGGAARAAAFKLMGETRELVLLARNSAAGETVASRTNAAFYPFSEAETAMHGADLVINATPMGMTVPDFSGKHEAVAVDERILSALSRTREDALIADMVYSPEKTMLMQAAERIGRRVQNGMDMLIFQALEAFYIWTGMRADEGMTDEPGEIIRMGKKYTPAGGLNETRRTDEDNRLGTVRR